MKVCVVGVGAVGGFLAGRLATSGASICAVARGDTLKALRERGIVVRGDQGTIEVPLNVSDNPAELGPQDLVIVAVKAPALTEVSRTISPLLGPDTAVMPAMNGVPWWFFQGFGGPLAGRRLDSLDPNGSIAHAISVERIVGCVVHGSFSVVEPGVIQHGKGRRFIVGEPDGSISPRVQAIAAQLEAAGLEAPVSIRIQTDIWFKLWGNMTMNPISGLTGATVDRILDDPLVSRFCLDVMAEAARLGAKIGCPIEQTGEERMAVTRKIGAARTSMLQDVEEGHPVELDALVTAVYEIARLLGEKTPNIDLLLGLSRLHARVRRLYPD